jgi:hypothetical protein
MVNIEPILAELWATYQRWRADGEGYRAPSDREQCFYAALVGLAEVGNVLDQQDAHDPVAQKWKRMVGEEQISDAVHDAAIAEAMKKVSRALHILSVGTTFIYEELVLVITIRVELGLFAQFLARRGEAPDFRLSSIDDEMRRVAGYRENAGVFRSAQAAARKNWGAPIQSSWLESTE